MGFRIEGLAAERFAHLFGLDDAALAAHGAKRCVADAHPGFPDRVEMRDANIGESLILVNYEHLPAASPYRSRHAVFVLENASRRYSAENQVPEVLRRRMISLRAFDEANYMVTAQLVSGNEIEAQIEQMLANPQISYLHAHYAAPGCYAARIDRV